MGGERIADFKQLAVGLIFFTDFQGTLKERKKAPNPQFSPDPWLENTSLHGF